MKGGNYGDCVAVVSYSVKRLGKTYPDALCKEVNENAGEVGNIMKALFDPVTCNPSFPPAIGI